jgi:hypothetical protein
MSQTETTVNQNGTKVTTAAYDPSRHEDATTVLVRPDGRAIPHDSLDSLVEELKSEMMKVGTYEFYNYSIISEERDISIREIQLEFLSEDWSKELPPSHV